MSALRLWRLGGFLCLGMLLCTACHREEGSASPPEAEEKTAQATVWSERFEIFFEHRLLVVNTPTTFITHVTDLTTLEPRREGAATFVLQQGTATPRMQTVPAPARDGIYLPELTFPTPGVWQLALRLPLAGQEVVVTLPQVTVFSSREEAQQAPEPAAPDGISFLKEQQWKILTQTEPVTRRSLTERLRLTGTVLVHPGHKATVTPPTAGKLALSPDSPLPSLGMHVKAGQVLAMVQPHLVGSELLTYVQTQQQMQALDIEITVRAATAEAEAIRARAALTQAEQALRRIRTLREQNAKSTREVEEAEFAQRKAEADLSAAEGLKKTYEQAKKQLAERPRALAQLGGIPAIALHAPITGVIVAINAAIGEHVHAETPVFSILNTDTVLIEAQLPEAELGRLGPSYRATYETPAAPGTFVPLFSETGHGSLLAFGTTVDAKTRTVPLLYAVPNPERHLRIGMALTVYVETARVTEALAVPLTALVEEDGQSVAFVQIAGETFHKRALRLGIQDGPCVQVLAGLSAGERVVTKGAYAIRLASVSSTIPAHGHAH
ncbi:MAG: efflux RND transporter periplasmic adaptor subunit [Candidatus Tectimicrobiota bacterium]